jgi:hypothetical protein
LKIGERGYFKINGNGEKLILLDSSFQAFFYKRKLSSLKSVSAQNTKVHLKANH